MSPALADTRPELVTVTGDGTLAAEPSVGTADADAPGARLQALARVRALLGDRLEEQIGTIPYLPAALGTESADQLLPASLAQLAGTTGDLAGYGWRVGTGAGRAWHRARELRDLTLEAARIALLDYEGPLMSASLGPLTLAAATFLPSGERTLADHGAVRDLPELLAEGLAAQVEAVRERVPGAAPGLLIREDAAGAVHGGRIPTPSGYRRYRALPAAEMGTHWQRLREALESATWVGPERLVLTVPTDVALVRAALAAGWRALAIDPAAIAPLGAPAGSPMWEELAAAREAGVELWLSLDPERIEPALDSVAAAWTGLGFAPAQLRGFTLMAHPRSRRADPSLEPSRSSLLTGAGIERALRAAPAWAERVDA